MDHGYWCTASDAAPPCLQVHDELLFEVRAAHLSAVAPLVKEVMESCVQLSVPLPVKLNSGPSWGEMQEMEL